MLAMKQSPVPESSRQTQIQSTSHPSTAAKPRSVRSLWQRTSTVGCIVTCAVVFWSVANTGAKIDSLNYNVDKMQTQLQKASAENASLTVQVDKLQQPDRILGIALGQLHMQYASPVHIQATSPQAKH